MIKLKPNKYYKLKINLHGRTLDYEGKILSINKKDFRLETEEHNKCLALTFDLKDVLEAKEIVVKKEEDKVFKIYSKKKFVGLRESEKPRF